jgi:hypothetical protein
MLYTSSVYPILRKSISDQKVLAADCLPRHAINASPKEPLRLFVIRRYNYEFALRHVMIASLSTFACTVDARIG